MLQSCKRNPNVSGHDSVLGLKTAKNAQNGGSSPFFYSARISRVRAVRAAHPRPRSGSLEIFRPCERAQTPISMNKTDETLRPNVRAAMGHRAPSLWHWFQVMSRPGQYGQCRNPALYYNYPVFTRMMHLLGARLPWPEARSGQPDFMKSSEQGVKFHEIS